MHAKSLFLWLGALFVYFRDSRDSRDLLRKKEMFLEGHKSRKSRSRKKRLAEVADSSQNTRTLLDIEIG